MKQIGAVNIAGEHGFRWEASRENLAACFILLSVGVKKTIEHITFLAGWRQRHAATLEYCNVYVKTSLYFFHQKTISWNTRTTWLHMYYAWLFIFLINNMKAFSYYWNDINEYSRLRIATKNSQFYWLIDLKTSSLRYILINRKKLRSPLELQSRAAKPWHSCLTIIDNFIRDGKFWTRDNNQW